MRFAFLLIALSSIILTKTQKKELQEDLTSVSNWLNNNELTINIKKSKVMTFNGFRTSLEMTTLSYSASLSNLASHLYYDMTTFISKLNKILIKSCRILINICK